VWAPPIFPIDEGRSIFSSLQHSEALRGVNVRGEHVLHGTAGFGTRLRVKSAMLERSISNFALFALWSSFFAGCNQGKSWLGVKPSTSAETQPGSGERDDQSPGERQPGKMILNFQSGEPRGLGEISELSTKETSIREDLQKSFCLYVYRLSPKSDFSKELGLLCDENRSPRPLFSDLDRYSKVVGDKPQAVELGHTIEGDFVESTNAVIYELPIPTRYFKEASIQSFMMAPADFGYFRLEGRIAADLASELGGDLQFGKHRLAYKSSSRMKDGKTFLNERETEMNTYQVQGGETNLGLGTEHLLGNNPDYIYLNTVTVTIGTKSGGTALLSVSRVKVRHNGYPEEARRLPIDSATAQATHVHDGVLYELAQRIIK
jgi:hypothetical protein